MKAQWELRQAFQYVFSFAVSFELTSMGVFRHYVNVPKKNSNGDANSYVKMGLNFMDFFLFF